MPRGYRQSIFIPDEFRELAEKLDRSVNWLAQQAFAWYLARSMKPNKGRKPKMKTVLIIAAALLGFAASSANAQDVDWPRDNCRGNRGYTTYGPDGATYVNPDGSGGATIYAPDGVSVVLPDNGGGFTIYGPDGVTVILPE
jgi:hypothetical protein